MGILSCKKCGSKEYVKNGIVRGLQRYKCKNVECKCNFVSGDKRCERGKPAALKHLAMLLYAVGGMSFNGIGRILDIQDTTVSNWIRKEAENIPEPEITAETKIVMLDEMWHFIQKKLKNYGSGEQYALSVAEPLDGSWVIVVKKLAKN